MERMKENLNIRISFKALIAFGSIFFGGVVAVLVPASTYTAEAQTGFYKHSESVGGHEYLIFHNSQTSSTGSTHASRFKVLHSEGCNNPSHRKGVK